MANISKINALALANIAKVDAITKANIAKVNGLDLPSGAFTGLLDTYTGAAAAYSTRRLASATTVLLRVRRDTGGGTGDDDEANFKFDTLTDDLTLSSPIDDAGSSSATNLGQFLNATGYTDADSLGSPADGFVDTWTDQSGNSNNAEQTAHGSQPKIFDSSSPTDLIKENGKPVLVNTGNALLNYGLGNNDQQIFGVIKATTAVTNQCVLGSSNNAFLLLMTTQGSSSELRFSRVTTRDNGAAYSGTSRNDARLAFADQTLLYCDYTTTATNGNLHFGFDGNFSMTNLQEVIIYPDTATHTVGDIETNINSHFGIF